MVSNAVKALSDVLNNKASVHKNGTNIISTVFGEDALAWDVVCTPAIYKATVDGKEQWMDAPQNVLYRSDTGTPLGLVGSRYKPLGPKDILKLYKEFADSHKLQLSRVGSLDEGRVVFGMIKDPQLVIELKNGSSTETIQGYYLRASAFDRSMSFRTVLVAMRESTGALFSLNYNERLFDSIWHNDSLWQNNKDLKLDVFHDQWKQFEKDIRKLSREQLTDSQAAHLCLSLLGEGKDVKELSTRNANIISGVMESFWKQTSTAMRGTKLGLLATLVEYTDIDINARSENNRLRSAYFGKGLERKEEMTRMLLETE